MTMTPNAQHAYDWLMTEAWKKAAVCAAIAAQVGWNNPTWREWAERVRAYREAAEVIGAPAADADPLSILRGMLDLYDRNTCTHESTHRGGVIWTICDDCDRKWADDQGGFVPYEDPPEVAAARTLLAGGDSLILPTGAGALMPSDDGRSVEWRAPSAPPSEADDDLRREAWSDFENACLTDGWVPAPIVRACREAFDAAWPQGKEAAVGAAVRAAMAAFGATGYPAERIAEFEDSLHKAGSGEAVALRQARFVLRDLHAKDPNCGYGKLADACERAADRAQADG